MDDGVGKNIASALRAQQQIRGEVYDRVRYVARCIGIRRISRAVRSRFLPLYLYELNEPPCKVFFNVARDTGDDDDGDVSIFKYLDSFFFTSSYPRVVNKYTGSIM